MQQNTKQRIDVFVSSTSNDLKEYRQRVRDALVARGFHPIMMEYFGAMPINAVEGCLRKVTECDLFIGIYAHRYGFCPNDGKAFKGEVSITELEYRRAKEHNMPCLLFVVDEKAKFRRNDPILVKADNDPRLADFIKQNTEIYDTYRNPDDLAEKVALAVENWRKTQPGSMLTNAIGNTSKQKEGNKIPGWAILLGLVFMILTSSQLLETFMKLLKAGDVAGQVVLTAVSLLALTSAFFVFLPPLRQALPDLPVPSWFIPLISQIVIFFLVAFGKTPFEDLIAEKIANQIVCTQPSSEISRLAQSATELGRNIQEDLARLILSSLNNPLFSSGLDPALNCGQVYAQLYPSDSQFGDKLAKLTLDSVSKGDFSIISRSALLTATINAITGDSLALQMNQDAVNARSENPPQLTRALALLEAVRTIDENINVGRTSIKKSESRYNLAFVYEDAGRTEEAVTAYNQSVQLYPQNYEARYALSALLLVRYPEDKSRLDQAIDVARFGWHEYLDSTPPSYCLDKQPDPASLRFAWDCFRLMTIEAGARLQRKAQEDTAREIETLSGRAILLAEANDQFSDLGKKYTAEAYYYYAIVRASQDVESSTQCLILSNILRNLNPTIPRHQQWGDYANTQIKQLQCS